MRRLVKVIGFVSAQRTCLVVPEGPGFTTMQYIEYTRSDGKTLPHFVRHAPFKMGPVMVPLVHVLDVLDREIKTWETDAFLSALSKQSLSHGRYVGNIKAWRAGLQGLQKTKAARVIQYQFRESMRNPKYRMCQNRLLREYNQYVMQVNS